MGAVDDAEDGVAAPRGQKGAVRPRAAQDRPARARPVLLNEEDAAVVHAVHHGDVPDGAAVERAAAGHHYHVAGDRRAAAAVGVRGHAKRGGFGINLRRYGDGEHPGVPAQGLVQALGKLDALPLDADGGRGQVAGVVEGRAVREHIHALAAEPLAGGDDPLAVVGRWGRKRRGAVRPDEAGGGEQGAQEGEDSGGRVHGSSGGHRAAAPGGGAQGSWG